MDTPNFTGAIESALKMITSMIEMQRLPLERQRKPPLRNVERQIIGAVRVHSSDRLVKAQRGMGCIAMQ